MVKNWCAYTKKPKVNHFQALTHWVIRIWEHVANPKTFLLVYFIWGHHFDITDHNISAALKVAALALGYPVIGFPMECINTQPLHSGGTNSLSLAG